MMIEELFDRVFKEEEIFKIPFEKAIIISMVLEEMEEIGHLNEIAQNNLKVFNKVLGC